MAARKWGNERTIGDVDATGGGNNKDWDVASLDGGGYVVTWLDRTTAPITAHGQRYDAAGNPVGAVFEIGAVILADDKVDIVVTGIDGGGFVAAFAATTISDAENNYYERYDAAGVLQSTFVWDSDTQSERNPAIVRIPGGFVLVETDAFDDGINADGIWTIAFNVNDAILYGYNHVNDDSVTGVQTDPVIAALTGGETVISWVDENDQTIKFRIYDSFGAPTGASVIADDEAFAAGVPEVPPQVVGLANGNFLIVWQESGEPDSGDQSAGAIRGIIYSATGTPQSGLLLINTLHTGDQSSPDVVATPDGGFFVSWTSLPTGIDADIKGLQFGPGGVRVGAEITINTTTNGIDVEPHLTVLSDGRIVVVWADVGTGILRQQIIDTRDGLVTGTANTETLYGNDLLNDELDGLAGADTLFGLAGADVIYGGVGNDTLHGGRGDDTLYGGADQDSMLGGLGADEMDGGDGVDTANYALAAFAVTASLDGTLLGTNEALDDTYVSIENLTGTNIAAQADTLRGNAAANSIAGLAGADTLNGVSGHDRLTGGAGIDTLTGGIGNDSFIYNTLTEGGDIITDFSSFAANNNDVFRFKGSVFGGLAAGAITAPQFQSSTSDVATTGTVDFFYETDTRILRFDADGSGAGASVIIATLQAGATMTFNDILIF